MTFEQQLINRKIVDPCNDLLRTLDILNHADSETLDKIVLSQSDREIIDRCANTIAWFKDYIMESTDEI